MLPFPPWQALLAHFRQAPERLGGLNEVSLALGSAGERLATVPGPEGLTRQVEVVLATQRDLVTSGFSGLEEGVYLVGSGSNGVCETMVGCM